MGQGDLNSRCDESFVAVLLVIVGTAYLFRLQFASDYVSIRVTCKLQVTWPIRKPTEFHTVNREIKR